MGGDSKIPALHLKKYEIEYGNKKKEKDVPASIKSNLSWQR